VCTAWFDEFEVAYSEHADSELYMTAHRKFIETRIAHLEKQPILRRASLISVSSECYNSVEPEQAFAEAIRNSIYQLHDKHHQIHPITKQKVSIGLVRMANINPMISTIKTILSKEANKDYYIHFCVYHSRFPMLIRSKIEEVLDLVLSRHDENKIWSIPEISSALSEKKEKNHIFVVFATPVAEVGRDHDYDWAIAEPSSMRSIIQLAGRIQRHRRLLPTESNLIILQKNIKASKGAEVAYCNPGFESKDYFLADKDLSISLHPSQYENITAIPRLDVSENLNYRGNLSDLEHMRLKAELLGTSMTKFHASMWWKYNADWCGVLQQFSRFRQSRKEEEYICLLEDENEAPMLYQQLENGELVKVQNAYFKKDVFMPAKGILSWINCDVGEEAVRLADKLELSLKEVSLRFARIKLFELDNGEKWMQDPILGFYRDTSCLHGSENE
jgi:CRISPR-associated endonuclease/helicase Cas3